MMTATFMGERRWLPILASAHPLPRSPLDRPDRRAHVLNPGSWFVAITGVRSSSVQTSLLTHVGVTVSLYSWNGGCTG